MQEPSYKEVLKLLLSLLRMNVQSALACCQLPSARLSTSSEIRLSESKTLFEEQQGLEFGFQNKTKECGMSDWGRR